MPDITALSYFSLSNYSFFSRLVDYITFNFPQLIQDIILLFYPLSEPIRKSNTTNFHPKLSQLRSHLVGNSNSNTKLSQFPNLIISSHTV